MKMTKKTFMKATNKMKKDTKNQLKTKTCVEEADVE